MFSSTLSFFVIDFVSSFVWSLIANAMMFDCTWYLIYQAAYVLMETFGVPNKIKSSRSSIKSFLNFFLFCRTQFILLRARSVQFFCHLFLPFTVYTLAGQECEQFRLLLRSFYNFLGQG
jgi:hypothetical protein